MLKGAPEFPGRVEGGDSDSGSGSRAESLDFLSARGLWKIAGRSGSRKQTAAALLPSMWGMLRNKVEKLGLLLFYFGDNLLKPICLNMMT